MINILKDLLCLRKHRIKSHKRRLVGFIKTRFATINYTPIIVLGNQKSGTSVIAHLLADYGGLSKTIDIPPLWRSNTLKILSGEVPFREVVVKHRYYFSTGLIKEPYMTFFIEQVFEVFPEARYVFVVRDPRDNIRSILNRMDIPGDINAFSNLTRNLRFGYRIMLNTEVWGINKTKNLVEILAHRWNKAGDSYLLHQDRMIMAKYEDFLADKNGFIEGLAQKLTIKKKFDITDNLDIQYQPRGNRFVSWEDFFGEQNLTNIETICGERMKSFGYSITKTASA